MRLCLGLISAQWFVKLALIAGAEDMQVDIRFAEGIRVDVEGAGTAAYIAQGRLRTLLHHIAQVACTTQQFKHNTNFKDIW